MRTGFTLLEVTVTLLVMAVVATLVTPAFSRPGRATATVAEAARSAARLAIRRAEWVTLRVDASGRWEVGGDLHQDTLPLATGTLTELPGEPAVLRLSPLGGCYSIGAATAAAGKALCRTLGKAADSGGGAER
jgi:prepilin-type N-terminal cleavage/methylation domain-containing protein